MISEVAEVPGMSDTRRQFAPSRHVLSAVHGDRTVLLDLRKERYYGLDEVGTRVWALLREGVDEGGILARLEHEYEAPRELLQSDLTELLGRLAKLGMITRNGERGLRQPRRLTGSATPRAAQGEPLAPSALTCALTLICLTVALRIIGLRHTLALVHRAGRCSPPADSPPKEILARAAGNIGMAAAFIPGRALCLEQSLALYVCLRRAGVAVDLRLGVQPYPFAAHAWVEYEGEPVGESWDRVGRFAAFSGPQAI